MQQDINQIFDSKIIQELKEYSKSKPMEEVCGFVYLKNKKQKLYKCTNIASQKSEYFIINPEDFEMCSYKGEILCSFHSHIKGSGFSDEDIIESKKNELPYLLYDIEKDDMYYFDPSINKD